MFLHWSTFDELIFAYCVGEYACSGLSAGVLILFYAANLAQIAFESVVSVVNSLHNSQELAKDHQGRNCLLATYLYFVFRLPDTQHEIHTTGTVGLWHHLDRQRCNSSPIQKNQFFSCGTEVLVALGLTLLLSVTELRLMFTRHRRSDGSPREPIQHSDSSHGHHGRLHAASVTDSFQQQPWYTSTAEPRGRRGQ